MRQESEARGHVSSHSHSVLHAPGTPVREGLRSHLDSRTPPLPPRERPHTSGHHGAGEARATAPSTVSPYGPEARAELSSRPHHIAQYAGAQQRMIRVTYKPAAVKS